MSCGWRFQCSEILSYNLLLGPPFHLENNQTSRPGPWCLAWSRTSWWKFSYYYFTAKCYGVTDRWKSVKENVLEEIGIAQQSLMFPFIPSDLNTNLYLVKDGVVAPILKTPILSSMIPPIEPNIKDMRFRFNSTGTVRTPENKTGISILLQWLTEKEDWVWRWLFIECRICQLS